MAPLTNLKSPMSKLRIKGLTDAFAGKETGNQGIMIYIIATIGPVMTIPQILKVWIEKSAAGISPITWISYCMLSLFWMHYGHKRNDKPIVFANILWIAAYVMILAGVFMYG